MAMNDDLPSKADTLAGAADTDSATRKVQETLDAVETQAREIGERGRAAYRSSNDAVARYVDPVPGMMLAAAAGFLVGCLWSQGRYR